MPHSLLLRAKRAFVSVLLKLAFDYGVAADVNRESDRRPGDQEDELQNEKKTARPEDQMTSKREDQKNRWPRGRWLSQMQVDRLQFMPGDRMVKFHCAVTKVLSES